MFLANKKILITGLLSQKSMAYGIAKICRDWGAELAFTYAHERFKDRVSDLAQEFESTIVLKCDVANDDDIENMYLDLQNDWPHIDGLVHSIAFASKEAISGDFLDGLSRESFLEAHNISVYSFAALAKAAQGMLSPNASLLTLSYIGAHKVVSNYNTMGVAKAALEATVRYTAQSLGEKGVRVNAISAGPIKTLAASGIKDFNQILQTVEKASPLKRNVNIYDVGNAAAFLLSDLASGITADVLYVDAGFHAVAGLI